jgi:hypothetical protein
VLPHSGGRNYDESMDALVQLTQGSTHYTLVHSSSQAHSADLIYNLARKEMLDGGGMVGLAPDFLDANAKRMAFLRELPGLGIVPVLALLSRFENMRDIINASPADLRHQLTAGGQDHYHDLVAQLHACFGPAAAGQLTAQFLSSPSSSPSSSSSSGASASSLTDVEDATPEATTLLRGQPKFNIATRLVGKPSPATSAPPARGRGRGRGAPRGRGRARGRGA